MFSLHREAAVRKYVFSEDLDWTVSSVRIGTHTTTTSVKTLVSCSSFSLMWNSPHNTHPCYGAANPRYDPSDKDRRRNQPSPCHTFVVCRRFGWEVSEEEDEDIDVISGEQLGGLWSLCIVSLVANYC